MNNSSVIAGLKDVPKETQNLELRFIFGLLSCVIMTHSHPNYVGVYVCVCDCLSAPSDCVCTEGAVCVFVIKSP